MSDAYRCEKCGTFNEGSGNPVRYGVYAGTSGFTDQYNFSERAELCDSCKVALDDLISDFLNDE